MMRDAIFLGALVLLFAVAVSTHVFIVAGLLRRGRPPSAALALVVPPAAPTMAWRAGMKARCVVWLASVVAYGGVFVASR